MEFGEREIKELKENVRLTKESIKWTKIAINMNRIAFVVILLVNVLSAVVLLKAPTYANIACSIVDTVCIPFVAFNLAQTVLKRHVLKKVNKT